MTLHAINPSVPDLTPQDAELEQAVLGCCIRDNDLVSEVFAVCQPSDFYHHPHSQLAAAIFDLSQAGIAITPLSIGVKLGLVVFEEIGGRDYLFNLQFSAPAGSAGNVIPLARMVADLRQRRDAISACDQAKEALERRDIPIIQALKPTLDAADIVIAASERRRFERLDDTISAVLKQAEDSANGIKIPAISTGLRSLDAVLGGLQAADLCILAGRPGMGKSSLLLTVALAAILDGRPAIFFSLEMTKDQLLHRIGTDIDFMAHPLSPLSYSWFRNGTARLEQVGRLAEALRQIPDILEIRDGGDLSIQEIASMAKNFAARHSKMGVVVIDYLQKINAGDRYRGNKVQEITEISGAAKALAKRLAWPVVAGAQLSRAVEGRQEPRPALSDLRESGAIEQDADSVIGLFRPGYYTDKRKPGSVHDPKFPEWEAEHQENKNRLDLLVLKNRHGSEDVLSVFCDMRASAIRDEKPIGFP